MIYLNKDEFVFLIHSIVHFTVSSGSGHFCFYCWYGHDWLVFFNLSQNYLSHLITAITHGGGVVMILIAIILQNETLKKSQIQGVGLFTILVQNLLEKIGRAHV